MEIILLEQVIKEVESSGILINPKRTNCVFPENSTALEGQVEIKGRKVTLRLELSNFFPLRLPSFFLSPWDALGFIPHIMNESGYICYLDPEGLVLDRRNPVTIILEAYQKAINVLTNGVIGSNKNDFVDEFEFYWHRLPGLDIALSLFNPSDQVSEIFIATDNTEKLTIIGSKQEIENFRNGNEFYNIDTYQKAIYLPLAPGTLMFPPRPDKPFWTTKQTRQTLWAGLSALNKKRLVNLLKKRSSNTSEYVIVRLPRPRGGENIFGIRFNQVKEVHPLHLKGDAASLTPLQIDRLDQKYLVQRGGGNVDLMNKRVLLIGSGAVGGHVAFELARSGVLKITVIDPDKLSPDNTFRHVLGKQYWEKPKVLGLKTEIERHLPFAQITPINNTIEKVMHEDIIKFTNFDLVIVAIGNPTIELEINQKIHSLEGSPPFIFTWLEPLGIGGHAILTRNGLGGGCFECLYTSLNDESSLYNHAAFAAPDQQFGKALSGCGSLYTPYASLDASRTANLAVRLALNTFMGREKGNPLLSWKGDRASFEAANFILSDRFNFTEEQLYRHRYLYKTEKCQVCTASSK